MKMRKKMSGGIPLEADGWTFVETIIVMSIVLVMTASVGFSAVKQIDRAKAVMARSQIRSFEIALDMYALDVGAVPDSRTGLDSLWTDDGSEGWNGPYVEGRIPADPWGNAYAYSKDPDARRGYRLVSYGKDGVEGGSGFDEDIVSE